MSEAFAADALESVARHGVSGCLDRDRETKPRMTHLIRAGQDDEFGAPLTLTRSTHDGELGRTGQSVGGGEGPPARRRAAQSDRQAMTTLGAPGLDYQTAILGRHSGAESVGTFAAQFTGLIGSFHGGNRVPASRSASSGADARAGDATAPAA